MLRVELKLRAKVVEMGVKTSVVAKGMLQVVLKGGDRVEGQENEQVKFPYASRVDVVGLEWLHVLFYELWRMGFH